MALLSFLGLTQTDTLMMLIIVLIAFSLIRFSRSIAFRLLRARTRRGSSSEIGIDGRAVSLLSGLIRLMTYVGLILVLLGFFVEASSLLWFVGLFSAGFGIGARPIISDYLTGISLIFEDSLEIGEKVEFPGVLGGNVEGVVESINLRTTLIRARSGEPLIVPNGEIRVIRNFSRANYSEIKVRVNVKSADAHQAVDILEEMATEAVTLLENLLEPWQVLSQDGVMGTTTRLEIVAHAKYGTGAIIRPRLMILVRERLASNGIELEG